MRGGSKLYTSMPRAMLTPYTPPSPTTSHQLTHLSYILLIATSITYLFYIKKFGCGQILTHTQSIILSVNLTSQKVVALT